MSATGSAGGGQEHRRWLNRSGGSAGFTLLEMLVTLAIMALIVGIAYPALQHRLARQALTSARMTLTLAVAQARADALARAMPSRLTLSDDRAALVFSSGRPVIVLPPGTALDWPRQGLTFFGDGSSDGAAGTIAVGAASLHFALPPDRGRLDFTP